MSCPAEPGHPLIQKNLVIPGHPLFAGDVEKPTIRETDAALLELCEIFATLCIFLNRTVIRHQFLLQCRPTTTTGGFMNVQATYYRRRAIVAKQSAAAAIDPYVKAAFKEVASHWLGLAEHIEWLNSIQRGSRREDGESGAVEPIGRKH